MCTRLAADNLLEILSSSSNNISKVSLNSLTVLERAQTKQLCDTPRLADSFREEESEREREKEKERERMRQRKEQQ